MQPNALALKESASLSAMLKAELLRAYPELADDDKAMLDTLDGMTDLSEIVALFIASADDDLALAEGCKARTVDLSERRARLQARADAKRRLVMQALERSGMRKIERPEFTASIRSVPPSVVILDDAILPPEYVKTKTVTTPDKEAIKAALVAGNEVLGATLSNGSQTLAIRRT